jgi:integrase
MNNLIVRPNIPPRFLPVNPSKDESSRLLMFADWMHTEGQSWVNPDLAAYRDHLLLKLAPLSVKSHLSTIRKAIKRIMLNRDYLYEAASHIMPDATMMELKPMVDEFTERLKIAIDPDMSFVKTVTVQDVSDSAYVRLTAKQADSLIRLPDRNTLVGLRDAALIGLALATGLRADELLSLRIDDLYHKLGGKDAIIVREGKGRKQRLVPYGAHISVLQLVHKWINTAGIKSGLIFRAVTRSGKLRNNSFSVRAFEERMKLYEVDGLIVTPHDLRRTYAKQLYLNGMDIVAIKDNLGHASIETTLNYIGEMNADKRVPVQGYHYL